MCNIAIPSLCRRTGWWPAANVISINAQQIQTGRPVWCWFIVMGLEYKCPSLHYHSPETLSALCLPFYQHNPPPCLLLLFQTGNRFGDFYYLMHSGCSAPITDECLVPLVRSDSLHQIFLAAGLHGNSGDRVLQQFSPWMFTFMSCALNESLHIAQTSIHCQEKWIAAGRCAMHIVLWLLYQ